MMVAGLPTTFALAGTSAVTTLPAPIIAPRPMVTPGRIVALAPIDAPSLIVVTTNDSGRWRLRGNMSLANVAFGPMNTSSPTRNPSHNCTPHFTVTRSPTTTSFSMNTPSQMLHNSPTRAPGNTWANAQTRVPTPISVDSHNAFGCTNTSSAMSGPRKLFNGLHDRERSLLRVLVGAPDVGADDAESE